MVDLNLSLSTLEYESFNIRILRLLRLIVTQIMIDLNLSLGTSLLVLGGDLQDAVGVQAKANCDLGFSALGPLDALTVHASEK